MKPKEEPHLTSQVGITRKTWCHLEILLANLAKLARATKMDCDDVCRAGGPCKRTALLIESQEAIELVCEKLEEALAINMNVACDMQATLDEFKPELLDRIRDATLEIALNHKQEANLHAGRIEVN